MRKARPAYPRQKGRFMDRIGGLPSVMTTSSPVLWASDTDRAGAAGEDLDGLPRVALGFLRDHRGELF